MPFIHQHNKVAVTKEELCLEFWDKSSERYVQAAKFGVVDFLYKNMLSLSAVATKGDKRGWGVRRLTTGGNGRQLLIDFDTLPEPVRDFLGDPRIKDNPLVDYFSFSAEAEQYYANFRRGNSYLLAHEQERYVTNASVLEAVIQLEQVIVAERKSKGGNTRGILSQLCYEVIDFNKWLNSNYELMHNLPSSEKRFKQSLNAFKTGGYFNLIKDPYGRTKDNARKVLDITMDVLDGLFDQDYKPSKTDIFQQYDAFLGGYVTVYNAQTGECYNPKEFPKLSDSTIHAYLSRWDRKMGTLRKRAGNRQKFIGKHLSYVQLQMPKFAGSVLTIDDRQPPFWYDKGKRMWFYVGFDVASQAVTTYVYGKSKEGIIVEFYRQMIRNYHEWGLNLPAELECESSLNSSFKDTFLKEGKMFEYVKMEANNAQGKYAERLFGILRNNIEHNDPAWIARPFAQAEHNQEKPGKVAITPFDELVDARLKDIEDYNNAPHTHHKEMSRWEYFILNQNKKLKPTNWQAILPYLGYKTKTSCKRGYVTLQGVARAIAENGEVLTGDALISKLTQIGDKSVDVYWIDGNEGEVIKALVYYKDRFICELVELKRPNRSRAEQTDDDKRAMAIASAYTRTIEHFSKEQAKSIPEIGFIEEKPVFEPRTKFSIKTRKAVTVAVNDDYTAPEILDDYNEDDDYILNNPSTGINNVERWKEKFKL